MAHQTQPKPTQDFKCWLDPIIDQQAKHYGLTREKFTGLMTGAALYQQQIDEYQVDEPTKTHP